MLIIHITPVRRSHRRYILLILTGRYGGRAVRRVTAAVSRVRLMTDELIADGGGWDHANTGNAVPAVAILVRGGRLRRGIVSRRCLPHIRPSYHCAGPETGRRGMHVLHRLILLLKVRPRRGRIVVRVLRRCHAVEALLHSRWILIRVRNLNLLSLLRHVHVRVRIGR